MQCHIVNQCICLKWIDNTFLQNKANTKKVDGQTWNQRTVPAGALFAIASTRYSIFFQNLKQIFRSGYLFRKSGGSGLPGPIRGSGTGMVENLFLFSFCEKQNNQNEFFFKSAKIKMRNKNHRKTRKNKNKNRCSIAL